MQGVMLVLPERYDLEFLWKRASALQGVTTSGIQLGEFSVGSPEGGLVQVRPEPDVLDEFDGSTLSSIRSMLGSGPLGVFPFEYRMKDLPFLSRVLVALLDSVPSCLCNDYGLVVTGESAVQAVSRHPEWDWRRADELPEGFPDRC